MVPIPTKENADIALMKREIVPFAGRRAMSLAGAALISNPDPILQFMSVKGEEEYRAMTRAEPALKSSLDKRRETLLSEGFEIQVGGSGRKRAETLKDFAVALMQKIPYLSTVYEQAWMAIPWGWRPMEIELDLDWRWNGKQCWGVSAIREKLPEHFRFTADRNLAYVGDGYSSRPLVFSTPEDKLRYLVCTYGSTDNPYGDALCKYAWLIYYIKQQFMQMLARGYSKSLGILHYKQSDTMPEVRAGEPQKTIEDLKREVGAMVELLDDKSVLIDMAGGETDWLGNVAFSSAWQAPIEYCDKLIRMLVQGETLSDSMGNDQTSNRASAETGMKGLQTRAKGDGLWIQSVFNDGLIAPMVRLNFGDVEDSDMPKLRSRLVARVDLTAAKTLFDMGAVIDGLPLANSAGVKIIVGDPTPDQVPLDRMAGALELAKAAHPPGEPAGGAPTTPPADPAKAGKPERIPTADGDTPVQRRDKAAVA